MSEVRPQGGGVGCPTPARCVGGPTPARGSPGTRPPPSQGWAGKTFPPTFPKYLAEFKRRKIFVWGY